VLGVDLYQVSVNVSPKSLMQLWTDQYMTRSSASTVPCSPIGGVTNERKLHSFMRAYETMQDLSAMNTNPDCASGLTSISPYLTYFQHGRLHLQSRTRGPLVSQWVWFWTPKYSENSISINLIDCPIMLEYYLD